ncbi:MAG TPA: cupredoxin domain-containing protein [Gemmatimonadaceae bacterium]|jgi:plastocyanin domain-containing protein
MSGTEWMVVLAAIGAIAWVNWYFFVAGRSAGAAALVAATPAGGDAAAVPQLTITVDGGYSPNTVRVPAGRPVRLVFDRRDTSSCSEEVVFPDFGVRRFLPTGQRTVVEVTPPAPGRYEFMCGMSMLRGALIAEK